MSLMGALNLYTEWKRSRDKHKISMGGVTEDMLDSLRANPEDKYWDDLDENDIVEIREEVENYEL